MNIGTKLLHNIDFNSSLPAKNTMKALFASTILSRATCARRKEEVREVLTRDIPAFCIFFSLAPILENIIAFGIDKFGKNKLPLTKGPGITPEILNQTPDFFKKTQNILKVANPLNKYKVRSFKDIETVKDLFKGNEAQYNKLIQSKTSVFLASMAITIGVLGIFIPWLNVQVTREKMLSKQCGNSLETIG